VVATLDADRRCYLLTVTLEAGAGVGSISVRLRPE
jgi:hypothetical protein